MDISQWYREGPGVIERLVVEDLAFLGALTFTPGSQHSTKEMLSQRL